MHLLSLFAAAIAVTFAGMFDGLALFVGKLVIIASLIWSGFCLLSYLIKRSAPPAVVPATVPPFTSPSRPASCNCWPPLGPPLIQKLRLA